MNIILYIIILYNVPYIVYMCICPVCFCGVKTPSQLPRRSIITVVWQSFHRPISRLGTDHQSPTSPPWPQCVAQLMATPTIHRWRCCMSRWVCLKIGYPTWQDDGEYMIILSLTNGCFRQTQMMCALFGTVYHRYYRMILGLKSWSLTG